MSRHGDHRGQIADFWDRFERINWLYLLLKCGIKTKTHFEGLLWHWSSLGQLNLEPTRPNGLKGCKVLTDLVRISVKEATPMGFYYKISMPQEDRQLLWMVRTNHSISSPRLRMQIIRRIGRRMSIRNILRWLLVAGYWSRRPARYPSVVSSGKGTGNTNQYTYNTRDRSSLFAGWGIREIITWLVESA